MIHLTFQHVSQTRTMFESDESILVVSTTNVYVVFSIRATWQYWKDSINTIDKNDKCNLLLYRNLLCDNPHHLRRLCFINFKYTGDYIYILYNTIQVNLPELWPQGKEYKIKNMKAFFFKLLFTSSDLYHIYIIQNHKVE